MCNVRRRRGICGDRQKGNSRSNREDMLGWYLKDGRDGVNRIDIIDRL